jgi:hypothetical protein
MNLGDVYSEVGKCKFQGFGVSDVELQIILP